jgi:hypothetical protein
VAQLLANQIAKRLLEAESLANVPGGLAQLDLWNSRIDACILLTARPPSARAANRHPDFDTALERELSARAWWRF